MKDFINYSLLNPPKADGGLQSWFCHSFIVKGLNIFGLQFPHLDNKAIGLLVPFNYMSCDSKDPGL